MPTRRTAPRYDAHQFFDRPHFLNKDSGLAYSDVKSNMRVERMGFGPERRLPTPGWALRDDLTREVLVAYLEERLRLRHRGGALVERMERCREAAKKHLPRLTTARDRLIEEYRRCVSENPSNEQRLRWLEIEICGKDSEAWVAERGDAEIVASILYLFHRLRWNSVSIAEELGMKPPHVRQILFRVAKVGARLFPFEHAGSEAEYLRRAFQTPVLSVHPRRRLCQQRSQALRVEESLARRNPHFADWLTQVSQDID